VSGTREDTRPSSLDGPATVAGVERADGGRRGYRPALDGVRAVAVLAVIAYHLGTRMHGGFLGVDVFFVLSGYLITGLLLDERARRGRISFPRFWARRARRLLPAVLLLTTVVALWTAHQGAVGTFAIRRGDLLSTIFYFANWHFIAVGQSYFAQFAGGASSPLRHMWSLAIEEQFYFLWPFMIVVLGLLVRRKSSALPVILLIAAIISAARMSMLYTAVDPTRAYEGTDARACELLVGAALAALLAIRPALLADRRVRAGAAWGWPVVAALVGVAFFEITDHASFYYHGGALAFSLVVACGLLIVEALPRSALARALSLRPVRWTGMISYGLYLWHWPVIVWSADRALSWSPRVKQLAEVGAMFAVAGASFYLLERPIRYGKVPWLRTSPRRLALVLGVTVLAVVGLSLHETSVPHTGVLAGLTQYGGRNCPPGSPSPAPPYMWCRWTTAGAGKPTIAMIGDSTALALDYGLESVVTQRHWGYIEAGEPGCSALPLMFPEDPTSAASAVSAQRCVTGIPRVIAAVAAKVHPNVWLLADRWMLLPLRERDGRVLQPGNPNREQLIATALRRLLRRLTSTGAKVIFLIQPPLGPPPQCAVAPGAADCRSVSFTTSDPETVDAQRVVERVAATMRGSVYPVNVDDILCPDHGYCPAVIDGVLARNDGIHYTYSMSLELAPIVVARARQMGLHFA
jgi:peptidoglycan/LPS O-acetylase OafA/YrhL